MEVDEKTYVNEDVFFNPNKILSHDKALNMILASRGYGKTYGAKTFAVNRHLKHGEQFLYIKRHKSDLENMENFFNDIREQFPDEEFNVKGRRFYINGNLVGRAIPLSTWQKQKSQVFSDTTVIIFDEFIKEKDLSYYLPNEVESFMNLLDTIVRNRSNWWVFMLGNAVTLANPYFQYFKLFPKGDQEIYKKGEILVNIPKAYRFKEYRKETKIGKLMQNTDYAKFSIDNEFKEDNEIFIERRTKESKYVCTFNINGVSLGLWHDKQKNLIYLSDKVNEHYRNYIVTDKNNYQDGRQLVTSFKDNYFTLKLGQGFKKAQLRFDNLMVRSHGYDLLNKLKVQ